MNLVRFLRRWRSFGLLAVISIAVALMPRVSFACVISDPSCYVHAPLYDTIQSYAHQVWGINSGGLIIAHWLEDLRLWLIDTVMVDAFQSLVQPVKYLFYLALVLAWGMFIISFMVQSFIDLRWVDLRRAARPMLVAFVVFTAGGQCIQTAEEVRLVVGSIMQDVAQTAAQSIGAPQISAANTKDLMTNNETNQSIYANGTACGTSVRHSQALFLNDYAARYLWADADDIHCAEAGAFAKKFRTTYFSSEDISNLPEDRRRDALDTASAGLVRQATGIVMVLGAVVEQLLHLLFALALALVWIALLLSLVFAVFLPTEELFSSQIKAILTILRASWTASFVLGLGLAFLAVAAEAGSAMLVLVCELAVLALCIWQTKQAIGMLEVAGESLNMTSGGAIQATGGMLKGWATTAAVVGAAVATGGGSAMVGAVGSTMLRRAGRTVGDNPLSQAAGRVLTNRVADKIDSRTQDAKINADADLHDAEAAWYERSYPVADGATIPLNAAQPNATDPASATTSGPAHTPERTPDGVAPAPATSERAQALRSQARDQRAQVLDRQAERARQKRNFGKADQLRAQAAQLRGDMPRPTRDNDDARSAPDPDPLVLDRALEQLHEAQDDPEAQRRILTETARSVQRQAQVAAVQRRAWRDAPDTDAPTTIQGSDPAPRTAPTAPADGLTRPVRRLSGMRPTSSTIHALDQEIAALAAQISRLERDATDGADADAVTARDDTAESLADLRRRLAAAQEQRARLRPTSSARFTEARTAAEPQQPADSGGVERDAHASIVASHPVPAPERDNPERPARGAASGITPLAMADGEPVPTLPGDQTAHVPASAPNQAAGTAVVIPAAPTHPHATTGATVPLSGAVVAPPAESPGTVVLPSFPSPAGPISTAAGPETTPAPTTPVPTAPRSTGDQPPHVGAVAATTAALPVRPTPTANGTGAHHVPTNMDALAAAPVPVMDAAPGAAVAPAQPAPQPVRPDPVPVAAPPVAQTIPAPVSASVAAGVPVTAPPAQEPVTALGPPVAAPVPSAGGASPAPVAAPAPSDTRRVSGQPTRAPRAAVLPQVPEVRSRSDQPVTTNTITAPATGAAQPWKRRKKAEV